MCAYTRRISLHKNCHILLNAGRVYSLLRCTVQTAAHYRGGLIAWELLSGERGRPLAFPTPGKAPCQCRCTASPPCASHASTPGVSGLIAQKGSPMAGAPPQGLFWKRMGKPQGSSRKVRKVRLLACSALSPICAHTPIQRLQFSR